MDKVVSDMVEMDTVEKYIAEMDSRSENTSSRENNKGEDKLVEMGSPWDKIEMGNTWDKECREIPCTWERNNKAERSDRWDNMLAVCTWTSRLCMEKYR